MHTLHLPYLPQVDADDFALWKLPAMCKCPGHTTKKQRRRQQVVSKKSAGIGENCQRSPVPQRLRIWSVLLFMPQMKHTLDILSDAL